MADDVVGPAASRHPNRMICASVSAPRCNFAVHPDWVTARWPSNAIVHSWSLAGPTSHSSGGTRTTPTRSTPTVTAPTRSTPTVTAPTRSTPTVTTPTRSTQTVTESQTTTVVAVTPPPATTTTSGATTTSGVSPAAVAAAAAASQNDDESSSTQWGWIAFAILAAAVLIGGIVW